MKSWIKKFLYAAVLFAAGYGACALRAHHDEGLLKQQLHDQAEQSYGYYSNLGFTNFGDRSGLETLWAEQLHNKLERDLSSGGGMAYLVLKDKGSSSWNYRADMTPADQDDIIRYLCFRISKGAGVAPFLAQPANIECHALLTYPHAALHRNSNLLQPAIKSALESRYNENLKNNVERLLADLLDEPWAQEMWWDHYHRYILTCGNSPWFNLLNSVISCSTRNISGLPGGQPTPELKAAAKAMIERIRTDKWEGHEWTDLPDFMATEVKKVNFVIARDVDKAFERQPPASATPAAPQP